MISLLPRAQYGSLQPAQPQPGSDAQRGVHSPQGPAQLGAHKTVTPLISVSAVAPDLLLSVQEQRSLNGISTKSLAYSARNGPASDATSGKAQSREGSAPRTNTITNAVAGPAQPQPKEAAPTDFTAPNSISLSATDPFSSRPGSVYLPPEIPQTQPSRGDFSRGNTAYISAGADHGRGFNTAASGTSLRGIQDVALDIFV